MWAAYHRDAVRQDALLLRLALAAPIIRSVILALLRLVPVRRVLVLWSGVFVSGILRLLLFLLLLLLAKASGVGVVARNGVDKPQRLNVPLPA